MNTLNEMLNDLFAIKAGKRNNKDDQSRVQQIHDYTVEMGVHDMMKIGARFSASDKEMMKKIHGYSIDMGATCDMKDETKTGKDEEMKSVNLQQAVDNVRNEFYEEFNKPTTVYANVWVMEIYDDHVIAQMGEEIYQINYTEKDGKVEFDDKDKWQKVEKEYVPVKAETMVAFGSEVKSYDGDKVGGYLVRFSDASNPDTTGDYFTKETDFGFTKSITSPIYLHHCLPVKTSDGARRITKSIGEATLSIDDDGVSIDGKLYEWIAKSADEYVTKIAKTVKKAIKAGKMGWSSGTAPHLVEREKTGNAFHIKKWPLGLDSTITPTPAGIRQGVNVLELKSVTEIDIDDSEVKAEGSDASALTNQDGNKTNQQTNKQKGYRPMENQEKDALVGEVVTSVMTAIKTQQDAEKAEKEKTEKMEADRKKEIAEGVKAALKDPETLKELGLKSGKATNGGGIAGANLNLKTELGDSPVKAFVHFMKTGDSSGIRTGEAYENFIKTDYPLLEGTQYQGQEAVPTEVVKTIVEKRDQISVARAAGAIKYPASSNASVIPIEKAGAQKFGITTINNSNTFTTQTSQPLDKLAATIYMFTYNMPIDVQLIDDSVFDVEGWAARRVGRGWGLTENQYYLMGTGTGQPQGAIYGSTLGVTSASATAVTPSEVVDQFYKLPGEYRDNPVWVMAGATEGMVRKLTSSTFPFIGTGGNSGAVGQQSGTNTVPAGTGWLVDPKARVFNSSEVDAFTSNKKPIFIGNFEAGYAIIERKGLTVLRDPYSAASKGMVNLWWYFRQGGGIVNADALYHMLSAT